MDVTLTERLVLQAKQLAYICGSLDVLDIELLEETVARSELAMAEADDLPKMFTETTDQMKFILLFVKEYRERYGPKEASGERTT